MSVSGRPSLIPDPCPRRSVAEYGPSSLANCKTKRIRKKTSEKRDKFENVTFERIKPIVLGFLRIGWESGTNPRTMFAIRPKVAFYNFLCFFECRIGRKTPKIENATFERISTIVLGFVRIGWESGTNPRTIRLIRSKVAFQFFFCFFECRIGRKTPKIENATFERISTIVLGFVRIGWES